MADADSTSSENSYDKSEIKDMPPPCLPSKPLQKTKVLDEESKEKSPSKEKSEAVPQLKDKKEALPELAYKVPTWSGIPDELYSLEVLKNGCIISNIDLTSKPYHVFGRLPSCDVSLEHPSVSRHHAVVQYKASESSKGDKGFYIYDLGSTHGTTVNKSRLEAKRYYRLRVGYVFKFGGSSRLFILQGPEEPEDPESEPSAEGAVSSSSEVGRSEVGRVMSEEEYEEWKREREGGRLEEQDTGIDWGMGEDAVEEPANSGDLGQGDEDAEEHHFKDPKKTLRGFFEREGLELEYDVEEKGPGHARVYHCRVKLPIDGPSGDPLYAEAAVTGKKRESVLECAKEACRMLDAAGLLRQSTHESKKPKEKDWEENDYYDSDEDTFLDRTGSVEKKRLVRMKRAGKDEPTTETYESLMSKLEALNDEIKSHENKLQGDSKGQRGSDSNAADSLDDYMSSLGTSLDKSTISQIRRKLFELKKERQRLNKLVNIAKPAILPAISEPCPSEPGSENDEVLRNTQSTSVPSDSTITTTVDKDTNIRHEQLTSLKGETPMQVSVEELASPKESSDQNSQHPEQTSAEFVVPNVVKYNKRKHSIPRKICAKKAEVSEESKSPVLLMDEKQEQKTVGSGAVTVDSQQDSDENSDVEVEVVEIPDKKKKRSYGAPSQWQAVNDPTYSAWTPPEGQTGDGKTHLNEKFGY